MSMKEQLQQIKQQIRQQAEREREEPKPVNPQQRQKAKQPSAENTTQMQQSKRRMNPGNRKKILKLVTHWPDLFSLDECKPVKVGVVGDMLADTRARGLSITEKQIRFGLHSHTQRVQYLKALVAGGARYGLDGQPCGEVTPEQQQNAADRLARMRMQDRDGKP